MVLLNTEVADIISEVMPNSRLSAIAGKYVIQYIFGALGIATCGPLIDSVGVGIGCTISKLGLAIVLCSLTDQFRRRTGRSCRSLDIDYRCLRDPHASLGRREA